MNLISLFALPMLDFLTQSEIIRKHISSSIAFFQFPLCKKILSTASDFQSGPFSAFTADMTTGAHAALNRTSA